MAIRTGGAFSTCSCHRRLYDAKTGYHPGLLDGTVIVPTLAFLVVILGLLIFAKLVFPFALVRVPNYVLFAPYGFYLFLYGLGMKHGIIGFFRKPTSRIHEDTIWIVGGVSVMMVAFLLFLTGK